MMTQIYPNLYIGSQADYESNVFDPNQWSIVLAAKEPWHRQALGYTTRGAPKDHPNYLYLTYENKLILNLVDADNPDYIIAECIDIAIDFIDSQLAIDKKVAVFCNQGKSRSAGIGLLYLAFVGKFVLQTEEYSNSSGYGFAFSYFKDLYPNFNPSIGMEEYIKRNWDKYVGDIR